MARRATYTCPHCGKQWVSSIKASDSSALKDSGFLEALIQVHKSGCATRTPLRRFMLARKGEVQREVRPFPYAKIKENYNHPGMKLEYSRQRVAVNEMKG
jgi:transposase-like protein